MDFCLIPLDVVAFPLLYYLRVYVSGNQEKDLRHIRPITLGLNFVSFPSLFPFIILTMFSRPGLCTSFREFNNLL